MTLAYALSPRFLGAGSASRKILSGTVVASALYAGYVGFSAFYSVNKRFFISLRVKQPILCWKLS